VAKIDEKNKQVEQEKKQEGKVNKTYSLLLLLLLLL
jgi:hypothetical protein